MRRYLGGLVVLTWLGMVGWQVRRAYFQPELARLAEAALSLAPGVSFYTFTMGGGRWGRPRRGSTPFPTASCWRT